MLNHQLSLERHTERLVLQVVPHPGFYSCSKLVPGCRESSPNGKDPGRKIPLQIGKIQILPLTGFLPIEDT